MRIVTIVLLSATALGLAACDKGPSLDLKNVTPVELSKAMKDSGANRSLVRPGKWTSTMTIAAMDTSHLPPDMAAKLNEQVGKQRTVEACLTPEQVDHPENMLGQGAAGCRYEHYKMGGGTIDGHMVCSNASGVQDMVVAGNYGKDRYAMTVTTTSKASPGGGGVSGSSTMKVESKRLGECDAKPAG